MIKISALAAICFCFSFFTQAQELPEAPNPPRLVNDFAGVLNSGEINLLEEKLLTWEDSTSNQLAIVIVKNLNGMDVADYSVRLAEKWKIGSKKNNGILLLVSLEDRKSRIEVGYGLEARITDAVSNRILANELKPAFKEQRYLEGFQAATDRIMQAAAGEYKAENKKSGKKLKGIGWSGILLVLILLFLFSRKGGGGGGGFITGMILGNLLGGNRHSSWGDFSSGRGSFGGFGGGSFGGGGASGDW